MEYGLRVVSMDYYAYDPWAVLILVLMEYGLRERFIISVERFKKVLILVLMEYGLRVESSWIYVRRL